MEEIDPVLLPKSALLDTTVLVPALGKAKPTDDPLSRALWDALYASHKRILIAAPSAAELWRSEPVAAIPPQVESIARAVGLIPDLEELSEYVAAIREALELEGYQPEGAALSAINDIAAKLGAKP